MLRVYQLASTPGRLRLWIGTDNLYSAGNGRPAVFVNSNPVKVTRVDGAAFELESPRIPIEDGRTVQPLHSIGCGVYDVDGLFPSESPLLVRVALGLEDDAVKAHVLPAEIGPDPLHVLVASCYYHPKRLSKELGDAIEATRQAAKTPLGGRIDLVLLLGDQVYLDLPLRPTPNDRAELGREFGAKYVANWLSEPGRSGLSALMKLGPVLCIGDDHELWNNAPFSCPWVTTSWSENGRANWRAAALGLFRTFQEGGPWPGDGDPPGRADVQRWRCLDVPPYSFFFCDTLWQRTTERLLTEATRQALAAWVVRLNDKGWHGIFCSGVSLLQKKNALRSKAALIDAVPADFADGPEILGILAQIQEPRSLLILGGDFHFGRTCSAPRLFRLGDVTELLASPVALVDSPLDVSKAIRGFWSDWPRHEDPNFDLGKVLGRHSPVPPASDRARLGKRGDHLCLLKLYESGTVQARFIGLRDHRRDASRSQALELFPAFGETRGW